MAKYKGTVNMPATHVFKTGSVLDGTQTIWANRYQQFPIKIGKVEDIISQFSPFYFSTDTNREHPYYWAHWNSGHVTPFDFNNADITFLCGDNTSDTIGLDNDANPKVIYPSSSSSRPYSVDRDKYGISYPASLSSNSRTYGYSAHGRYENHNVDNNTTAVMTNVVKYIKNVTTNSDNVRGVTPIEDRGALLVPNPSQLGMYYKEYQSGALEGAVLGTSNSSSNFRVNMYTDATLGDFNADFQVPPKFTYIRYKRRSDNTYQQVNVGTLGPYDLWLYGYVQSNVYHSIYNLHYNPQSAFAFLRDNSGDIWILTVNLQSEGAYIDTEQTMPWPTHGNNMTMLLYKVKDLPLNGSSPNVTMVDVTPTDTWTTTTTLTYVDDTVYDINGTFQELLNIEEDQGGDEPEPGDDPYQDIEQSEEGGGEGTLDWTSDDVEDDSGDIYTPFVADDATTGNTPLYNVYHMGINPSLSLSQLHTYMWTDSNFLDAITKSNADIRQSIISLHALPYVCTFDSTTSPEIILCGHGSGVHALGGVPQKEDFDLGSIEVKEFYGSYLDYSPFTSISIYLPFIGTKDLPVDRIMGKTVSLKYTFDNYTGNCVARIFADGNLIDCYNGQCSLTYPITGADYSQKLMGTIMTVGGIAAVGGGLLSMGGSIAAGAAIGKVATAGALAGGAKMLAGGAASAMLGAASSDKASVYHNSNLGGSTSWYAHRTPFLTITSPRLAHPKDKLVLAGGRTVRTETVGDLSGFTQFEIIHLDQIDCTPEERDAIEEVMTRGVII